MKKKYQNQKMTIRDLASMVDKRFKEVDKKLKNFATKDDLKNFATKDDLKKLKEELKEETIEARDAILRSNDKIAKFLKDIREEQAMLIGADRRHEEKLEDHEKRINVLEIKVESI
jgi:cell division protein ZapA (FtsZ GTPase activity inhibitor)